MTPLDRFIARWSASGDAERANKDSFLNELCDVLGVERPHPKTGFAERDLYVFEKDVARTRAGGMSVGRVDLYKHGSFLLEAKQGAAAGPKRRDSPAWNQMMSAAHGQALGYAAHLDAPPPFLLVCDIGYCFDVYASFDGTGEAVLARARKLEDSEPRLVPRRRRLALAVHGPRRRFRDGQAPALQRRAVLDP